MDVVFVSKRINLTVSDKTFNELKKQYKEYVLNATLNDSLMSFAGYCVFLIQLSVNDSQSGLKTEHREV